MMKDRDQRFGSKRLHARALKSDPTSPIEKDPSPIDLRRVLSGRQVDFMFSIKNAKILQILQSTLKAAVVRALLLQHIAGQLRPTAVLPTGAANGTGRFAAIRIPLNTGR